MKPPFLLLCLVASAPLIGCQSAPSNRVVSGVAAVPPPKQNVAAPKKQSNKPITNREPNTNGKVFILEYHKFEEKETRWGRTPASFRRDLELLYAAGFRPITLSQYLQNKFEVPPGATPVVFTFDDGHESQFRILPNGEVDPKCAVGIWKKFAETRPDFPVRATFFVLPPVPFVKKDTAREKLAFLKSQGSEIGVHTLSHHRLDTLTDEQVKKEIGGSIDWVRSWGIEPKTMAMPYGIYPKNKSLLKEFKWNGKRYKLDGAVRVGAVPMPSPSSENINRWGLGRIQGISLPWGLRHWLQIYKKGEVKMYVAPRVAEPAKPKV